MKKKLLWNHSLARMQCRGRPSLALPSRPPKTPPRPPPTLRCCPPSIPRASICAISFPSTARPPGAAPQVIHRPPSCRALAVRAHTPPAHSSPSLQAPQAHLARRLYATTFTTTSDSDEFTFAPDPVGAKLIPMVNQLQEAFAAIGQQMFELPQIVVVGSQSSGKSSVIEALVGRDFLPRGTGIVTRRPLILQLVRETSNDEGHMYGTSSHTGSRKFTDFAEIRTEIERDTERVAGSHKGISSEPIVLRIHASHVLPLSLVDLPGVTRLPVGDQPSDIEAQVRRLVLQYISRPSAIILAVTPANADPSTSDALQLARQVDPEGARTLGVLTKLDLMDKGTDATELLSGRLLPLRLGFVPVVNRSQSDILKNKPIRDMWRDERAFFRSHPAYSPYSHASGSRFLAQRCNALLTEHIRRSLPQLKDTIYQRTKELKAAMQAYGEAPFTAGESAASQGWRLLQILNKFAAEFSDAIDGQSRAVITSELTGGARIRYLFQESYAARLRVQNPLEGITLAEFRTALSNASGPRAALFVPEAAFEMLVRRQIERLREPSIQCAELVLQELLRIVAQLENKELVRFTLLRQRVVEVSSSLLKRLLYPTTDMINKIIDCELSYINTSHPDFLVSGALSAVRQEQQGETLSISERDFAPDKEGSSSSSSSGGIFGFLFGRSSPPPAPSPPAPPQAPSATTTTSSKHPPLDEPPSSLRPSTEMSSRERAQIALVKQLLTSYLALTVKGVQDSVTKAIMHFLVAQAKAELQKALVSELYKEQLVPDLLQESDDAARKRLAISKELHALKRAKKLVQGAELAVEVEGSNPLRGY